MKGIDFNPSLYTVHCNTMSLYQANLLIWEELWPIYHFQAKCFDYLAPHWAEQGARGRGLIRSAILPPFHIGEGKIPNKTHAGTGSHFTQMDFRPARRKYIFKKQQQPLQEQPKIFTDPPHSENEVKHNFKGRACREIHIKIAIKICTPKVYIYLPQAYHLSIFRMSIYPWC